MNKIIKELAEQCWDKRLDGLHFDQEKFAELIVRECAKVGDFECPRCGHCCPQQTWVGLTDTEIGIEYVKWDATPGASMADFARAIETALQEKNSE